MVAAVETMFYNVEAGIPWHNLGVPVNGAQNSSEAIRLAGIEWEVYNAPLFAHIDGLAPIEMEDRVANIRSSDNAVLGVVSNKYKIVQNKTAFEFTDNLLGGAKHVKYETAGSLFGGKRVWLLAKMDNIKILGDDVDPYLVFMNSHDGSTGVRIAITPIRVVCNNTLSLALEGATRVWSAIHTGNIMSKMYEAQNTLQRVRDYLDKMPEVAELMADTNIYPDEVEGIMDELFPTPKEPGKVALANIERQKNALFTLWETLPDIQKFEGTAWGLYNAASYMAGHMVPLRETSNFQESRFVSLTEGHPLVMKAQEILMKVRT